MVSIRGRIVRRSKKRSMLGLASEWIFEKKDRKFYSGSSESEHKNKSSSSKD